MDISLLRSLVDIFGTGFYKHFAPNGAKAPSLIDDHESVHQLVRREK
jgi:hypothetical protein